MMAKTTELNRYIAEVALLASKSESELSRSRWTWLLQPSNVSIESLISRLRSEETTSKETLVELENTYLWISLFDEAFARRKFSYPYSLIQKGTEQAGSQDAIYENTLIRYLIACRDGNSKSAQWLLNTLRSDERARSQFDINSAPTGTATLLASLDEVVQPEKKGLPSEVVINLGHWEIRAHGKRIISKSLCLLIELLQKNISISFEELLAVAFDIPSYNESSHYPKVQNLISRLRYLSPAFLIHTKQGRIYSSIEWDLIEIHSLSVHQESLKRSAILTLFMTPESGEKGMSRPSARVSMSKIKAALAHDFSRNHFEKITGLPRSTASRYIKNLLNKGVLVKSGSGKATIYRFKELQNGCQD